MLVAAAGNGRKCDEYGRGFVCLGGETDCLIRIVVGVVEFKGFNDSKIELMADVKSNKTRKWIFGLSITFNIIFGIGWWLHYITSPTYELGVLTQDVNAGFLGGDTTMYKIPKGITVRDVSDRGIAAIGQFENNKFEIVITTDRCDLVNYNISKDSFYQFGNYYSADKPSGTAR